MCGSWSFITSKSRAPLLRLASSLPKKSKVYPCWISRDSSGGQLSSPVITTLIYFGSGVRPLLIPTFEGFDIVGLAIQHIPTFEPCVFMHGICSKMPQKPITDVFTCCILIFVLGVCPGWYLHGYQWDSPGACGESRSLNGSHASQRYPGFSIVRETQPWSRYTHTHVRPWKISCCVSRLPYTCACLQVALLQLIQERPWKQYHWVLLGPGILIQTDISS